MKKPYKNCMYYYIKLFENDLTNHRVIEDKPEKFRRDLNSNSFYLLFTSSNPGLEGRKQGGNGSSRHCLPD